MTQTLQLTLRQVHYPLDSKLIKSKVYLIINVNARLAFLNYFILHLIIPPTLPANASY